MNSFQFEHIDSATTTTVSERDIGVLHSVVVNTAAAGAITVSDNSGTIAILKSGVVEGTYLYDVSYSGYLKVVTAHADSDVTICYN